VGIGGEEETQNFEALGRDAKALAAKALDELFQPLFRLRRYFL
jgi:hypothetical protein